SPVCKLRWPNLDKLADKIEDGVYRTDTNNLGYRGGQENKTAAGGQVQVPLSAQYFFPFRGDICRFMYFKKFFLFSE
ncbi:MAG: hypothetical protein JXB10_20535, partial [Pirellulales bacterium]|nr:hypothetical protein [Pirellulales bacterium]